jgi:nitrite reductase/ring-hydroxylating ferredoxin subunit
MQNLKKYAKSRGILGFAFNTADVDYVAIANQTLELASRVLGLPYTLITDETIQSNITNQRYSIDSGTFVQWRNIGRCQAYRLSTYDETIVIDVDYIVQDPALLKIFEVDAWDYMLQRRSSLINTELLPHSMGPQSLPFVWATVFAFRKTPKAEMFFDLVERIQNNYNYYRLLFNIQERNYRNDFAFAMADIILNGYTESKHSIPGTMFTVDTKIHSIEVKDTFFVVRDLDSAYVIPRSNLHIMSKQYLQSDNFKEFVTNVTT